MNLLACEDIHGLPKRPWIFVLKALEIYKKLSKWYPNYPKYAKVYEALMSMLQDEKSKTG